MLYNVIRFAVGVKILSIYHEIFIRNVSLKKRLCRLSKVV